MDQDQPRSAAELPDDDREVRRLLQAGRLAEANALFDRSIGHGPADLDAYDRAAVLVNRAVLAWRLSRIPLALELAADGWTELAAGTHDDAATAYAFSMLGYLLEGMGHRRAALDTLRRSVQLARGTGDRELLATCLQRLGGALNFRAIDGDGDPEPIFTEARGVLAEGLALHRASAVHTALLGAYARSLAGLGELDAAHDAAEQVLELGRTGDDRWGRAVGNWVLGTVHRARGDLESARPLAAAAVSDAESINDTSLLLRFSQDLADICAALDDPVGEATALRRSVAAARNAADTLREGLGQALEQRRLAAQAQRLATAAQEAAARDPLTGLANRLGLERSAPQLLAGGAEAARTPWLVLIDVDGFKGVNDAAGHAAGDAALREIAQLLRHECRSGDLVARWAGDEFVVLLGDASDERDAGPVVAERIRAAVAGHEWGFLLGGDSNPTVSVGVASGPPVLDALFAAADKVLYQAKRQGRNRVAVCRSNLPLPLTSLTPFPPR